MKSEVLEFKPGVTERVALKFPTGKEITTARGIRMLFSLTDNRVMFTSAAVATKIQSLSLKIGEPFEIGFREVETEGRKSYDWKISKIPMPAKCSQEKPGVPTNGHATHHGIPYRDPKSEWLRCADEAVQMLVTVREHAAAQGLPVQFSGEDLRQVTATLFIQQAQQNRLAPSSYR
jgi:hypothetical protein